jgi:hypothetical protein
MFLLVGLLALFVVPALAQDATPTPGTGQQAQATATPDASAAAQTQGQTQTQAQVQGGTAFVRAANLIADAGVVDIYINGQLAIADVNPNSFSGWLQVPAGRASVAIVPAGEAFERAIIGPFNVTFAANSRFTLAATGSGESGVFDWTLFRETLRAGGQTKTGGQDVAGDARITLFHSIENAPAVTIDLFLVQAFGQQDQDNQQDNLSGQTNQGSQSAANEFVTGSTFDLGPVSFADDGQTFTVPAGLYNISVTPASGFDLDEDAGTTDTTSGTQGDLSGSQILGGAQAQTDLSAQVNWPSFSNVALTANTDYIFAVVGTLDAPFLVIHASDFSDQITPQSATTFGAQNQSSSTLSEQTNQGNP